MRKPVERHGTSAPVRSLAARFLGVALGLAVHSQAGGADDPTRQTGSAARPAVAKPAYPVSLFYSTGDAIVEYKWMPMDSKATIDAAFDILARRYHCVQCIL